MDSWARQIASLSPEAKQKAGFGPYMVDTHGSLRLPIESIRRSGPSLWPVEEAPGWTTLTLPDGRNYGQWLPVGSEYFFDGHQPISAHADAQSTESLPALGGDLALRYVLGGRAFAFAGRFFVLPDLGKFAMNSFQFHVSDMEPLSVFVGYRGHARRWPDILTPGIYRTHRNPSKLSHDVWTVKSTVATNVLKQRFFERDNVALTHVQAIGILQHHYIIGATDMLDLSWDLNIAKWFALNEFEEDKCHAKKFLEHQDPNKALAEASTVYTVCVRPLGIFQLASDAAKFFTTGVSLQKWEGLESFDDNKTDTPPYNLAPLWSEFPKRQRGFGVRGIFPGELDKFGAVLAVSQHIFHPVFAPGGWDEIGGPLLEINGNQFHWNEDSSAAKEWLMPSQPAWFKAVTDEVRETVSLLTRD